MSQYLFERAARRRRSTALFWTILFHLLLLGGIAWSGNRQWVRYLPEPVQQLLVAEDAAQDSAPAAGEARPRP